MNKIYGKPLLTSTILNKWNTKITLCAPQSSSWLVRSHFKRRTCQSHYIQYNCSHSGPLVRTAIQGCHKCAKAETGICEPAPLVEVRNAGWCPECEKSIAKKVENMKASMAKIGAMLAIVRTGERLQDVDMTHVGLMLTDIGILISDARARDRLGLGVMQIGEVIQDVTLLLTHFVLGVRPPSDESGKGNSTVAVPGLLLALFAMVRADLRDAKVEEKGLVRIGLGLGNVGLVIGGVKEVAVADVMRERYDSV